MTGTLTRRGALATIAAAAAAVPTVTTASPSVNALWQQRQSCIEASSIALDNLNEARASIPTWARPGPRLINSKGEYCGETSGAPLDEGAALPRHTGSYKVCRPSFQDVREHFDWYVSLFPNQREQQRARMRESFRKLLPRYRAKAAEYRRARIDELDAAYGNACEAQWEVETAIRNGAPSPERAAACILLEVALHAHTDDTIESEGSMAVAAIALKAMQSQLTGLLADHVAAFLRDETAPLSQHAFYGA